MSYERLELVDGVTKWDTEKVQHLEDAIIKNENDIQKYHNDTIVDVQADWDQSDNTAKNYVKNRTHYKDIKEIIIAKGFETETYEIMGGDEGYEEMMVVLTNNVIPCTTVLNSKEEMEKLKVNINGQPATIGPFHHSQDFGYASWLANNEIWIDYKVNKTAASWHIRTNYKANLPVGEQFIIDIYTERVEYMPLDEKYLPASVLEQPDWKCNDTDSSAYIKNRTHYDYWVSTDNYIYSYDSPDNPGHLPYIFEVAPTESDFLGGHGFFYNGFLFNSDSDWKMIGEEYDEDLDSWKTKYECQQIKHHPIDEDEILTMSAITYSQYDVGQGKRKYFVSIDCTFRGTTGGIVLYEAEMRSKTLDKRFLADFTVAKDWSVNDENDSGYINNRTHYQYLDYTKRLYWEDPILLGHISKLPYTETIRSQINSDEAPGYWLGENKYLLNDYVVDAYSNWEAIPEESADNYTVYRYTIRINEDVRYSVTAKVVYNGWGNDSYITWLSVSGGYGDDKFGKADIHYKQLDPGYLPDGVAQNPDWNEGDDNSPSYIDNKPFYEYQEKRILVYEGTIPSKSYSVQEPIVTGGKYLVTVNGVSEEVSSWYEYEGDWEWRGFSTSQLRVSTNNFMGKLWAGSTNFYVQGDLAVPYTISIEKIIVENELKQLDEKFIPDTIARTSEVVTSVDGQKGDVVLPLNKYVQGQLIYKTDYEEIGTNIHHGDSHAVLTKPINLDNFNIKIVSSAGEEDIILSEEKNYIISRKPDGSYILLYTGGVKNNSGIDELRIEGMIDGSGETYISYVELVTPGAALTVYLWGEIESYQMVPEDAIPDTIVRKDEIPTIGNIVTSINGKIGDVEVSYSDLGVINEEYIPETIARKSEVETVASFSKGLENNFQQYALTNDTNLNNITTNLHDITNNVQKLNNKQIEDYFIDYEEIIAVEEFSDTAVPLGTIMGDIIRPVHLKFVNRVTGEFQIIKEEDLTIENYDDGSFSFSYDGKNSHMINWFSLDPVHKGIACMMANASDITMYQLKPVIGKKKLDDIYIPDTIARAPKATLDYVTETPTAEQYNALLDILKQAGILI